MSSRSIESAFVAGLYSQSGSPCYRRNTLALRKHPLTHHVSPLDRKADSFDLDETTAIEILLDTEDRHDMYVDKGSRSNQAPWSPPSLGIPSDAILLLNLVTVLWGSQHAVIKLCVSDIDPSSFTLVRFFLGAILATPAWLSSSLTNYTNVKGDIMTTRANSGSLTMMKTTWRWGFEMGFWMFLGFAFQSIGLAYTAALRSGFLLYLNVKFVPFFAYILLGRKISIPTWVSAFTALSGTALLAFDGDSLGLNIGDVWSIAAAAASAMFILRLESASAAVPNAAALNASCLWVVTIASCFWCASQRLLSWDILMRTLSSHPLELLYLSAVTTALANWIQTKAQQKVTAERASVIYAMDPVWGALWANLLLGETLTGYGIIGACLITVAAATNAFLDLGSTESSYKQSS